MEQRSPVTAVLVLCALLIGCTEPANRQDAESAEGAGAAQAAATAPDSQTPASHAAAPDPRSTQLLEPPRQTMSADADSHGGRQAYFGDLHVHTRYSFDAYAFGTLATPADAYRYARGEAIQHPAGFDIQLRRPLDFYGVTDHAMFLGAVPEAADPDSEFGKLPVSEPFHNVNRAENLVPESSRERSGLFSSFIPDTAQGVLDGTISTDLITGMARSAWREIVDAAERFNDPGTFTTFIAYEYTTTTDERGNLHRNVIFRGDDDVPAEPFSRFHAQNPELLWDWMDGLRARGIDSLAIPHNSNGSNGAMFMLTDWAGQPIDSAYAEQRMRNEPLVEVTQVKGTSDTHPALSTTDEWANFEIMPYRVSTLLPSEPRGSYVRNAFRDGLRLEAQAGVNPYKFGLIGASDTHVGAGSYDETNFFSKIGLLDTNAEQRGSVPITPESAAEERERNPARVKDLDGDAYIEGALQTWSASGLAGVWAEENSRDAIFNAFRRKETFATTGPRILVRFFAGDLPADILEQTDWPAHAYRHGVSMGSDLYGQDGAESPRFAVWAARDALSAPLQRLQVIKVTTDDSAMGEQIFDVACAGGQSPDDETHRCPDNGATVDLTDCSFSEETGDAELSALWQDPTFNADQPAMYYVRVLENPTCRWSTWDAVRAGQTPRPDLQATLQERAWTSPIWYTP